MLVASPLWLAGLLALPLIWWLHRATGHGRSVEVPSLLPYRDTAGNSGDRRPVRRADPAWLRRALAVAALILALADISLVLRNRDVTVWLDDSSSMTARDSGSTRLQQAFSELRELKQREHLDSIEVRSLSNPARVYALDTAAPEGTDQPLLPPPASALRADREHWLVTDGNDAQLLRWAETAPLQRAFIMGHAIANVALTELSARQSLADPRRIIVEIEAYNASSTAATRTLSLTAAPQTLAQATLQLAAGERRRLTFDVPAGYAKWAAALAPADALPLDDRIELAAGPLQPVAVAVGSHCPAFIARALRAMPLLQVVTVPSTAAGGRILCAGDTAAPAPTPTLLLRPDPALPLQHGSAAWSATARESLQGDANQPVTTSRGVLQPDGNTALPLLRSVDGVLVTRSYAPPFQLASTLDYSALPPTAEARELPLLVQLLELTLDRPLLAPVSRAARDAAESALDRPARAFEPRSREARFGSRQLHLSWLMFALAAALLAWDLALKLRDRPYAVPAVALKSLALAALLAAATVPFWQRTQRLPPLLFLLDVSDSMPEQQVAATWQRLQDAAQRLQPRSSETLAFAGDVIAVAGDTAESLAQAQGKLDRTATDIAAGIRAALARQPAQSAAQVVVVSDGWTERADAQSALQLARDSGATVNWVTLGRSVPPAQLLAVDAPASAEVGKVINVAVEIAGTVRRDVRLAAQLGDAATVTTPVSAVTAGRTTLWIALPALTRGDLLLKLQLYDATSGALLDGRDEAAVISVHGPSQALYVAHGLTPLARSLSAGGWLVAKAMPAQLARLGSLDSFSLVVLDDIGASEVDPTFWEMLGRAVPDAGAGLLVLGGPRSFAAGGYRGSRLESLLPVTMERSRREQRAAVLFALDKSGSMAGAARKASRFGYARQAVLQTLESLSPSDRAAVLTFDVQASLIGPFDAPAAVATRLRQLPDLNASGGTRGAVALRDSARLLASEDAARRVLVLVSDGFLPDEDLAPAISDLKAAHIEFIALGVGVDGQFASLRNIATSLGGELFLVDEAAELPRLMRTRLDAGLGPVTRGPLAVHAVATPPFAMTDGVAWPRVLQYAVTRLRSPGNAILESALGEPVLAAQQLGSGRVAVMPAGLGAWAPDWTTWSDWPRFAGGLADWLGGTQAGGNLELTIRGHPGEIEVAVDVTDGREWSSKAEPVLQVSDPDGLGSTPALHAAGPGHFTAQLPAISLGRYRMAASLGNPVVRRSWLHQATGELAATGVNPQIDVWARQGLVRYLPAAGLSALTQAVPADRSIGAGWLTGAWLVYLASLLADCAGVLVSLAQRWRRRGLR